MADTQTAAEEVGVAETAKKSPRRFGGRLNAESAIVLFAIPVIVIVGFGTYAIWHATASLDSVEESTLAWPTIWQQIGEHVKLTFVSAFFVILIAVPARRTAHPRTRQGRGTRSSSASPTPGRRRPRSA